MVAISLDPKFKFRASVVLCLLSFIAVGVGLFELSKVAGTVKKSKIKVSEKKRDMLLLDEILEDRKQYSDEITKVKYSFPSSYYEIVFFTGQLERIAGENKITLEIKIDQNKKTEKESYDSLLFVLNLSGSYSSVSDFLTSMSRLPYHTLVDSIKMDTDGGKLESEIKFRLFLEK